MWKTQVETAKYNVNINLNAVLVITNRPKLR